MPRQHLTPGKDPIPIVQEAGWASGPVWTSAENLTPPGFFFFKHSFISNSLLYISSKLLPNVRTKNLGEGKKTWSVVQARGKGGDCGMQCIPVGPVQLDVVLHSPAPWWGIRGDPSTCQC